MIARVIPALRTPRGVEWFDYDIPENLDIVSGDLVRIPFRKGMSVGLVSSLQETSVFNNLKPITERFADIRLQQNTLTLLDALAARSFSSRPAVLHAWLGKLPKKTGIPDRQIKGNADRGLQNADRKTHFLPNHLFAPDGLIASAKDLPASKRILILTPWASRVPLLADALGAASMTSSTAMKAKFDAWSSFLSGEKRILVATRIGAWLAAEADAVYIDEPENDDHKQDELSPRYDARWLAEAAASFGVNVFSFGLTPSVSLYFRLTHDQRSTLNNPDTTPQAVSSPSDACRIPDLLPSLVAIDIHSRDWSSVSGLQGRALIELEEAAGRPVHIIHPIHGEQARLRCSDCGWTAQCPTCGFGLTAAGSSLLCTRCHAKLDTKLACPSCGGSSLSKSRPGRDKLTRELASQNIRASVHSITEWNQLAELEESSLVIVTDLSLLSGNTEDIRRRERLCIAFRRLADICLSKNARLVLQADPKLLLEAKDWLAGEKTSEMLKNELEERRQFHLPPAYRLLKLILPGTETHAARQLDILRTRAKRFPGISIQGPFPVLYRSLKRTERHIAHLVAPEGTETAEIRAIIEPLLATDTLLDLDPIAFFE